MRLNHPALTIKFLIGAALAMALAGGGCSFTPAQLPASSEPTVEAPSAAPSTAGNTVTAGPFMLPLNQALERITKKPFGIFILPGYSPVEPERFHGYHTGVDFETFPNEQNMDVEVHAICSGPLLRRAWARGYGGMVVEACTLDKQPITVVYGHLNLASVAAKIGVQLTAGDTIGVLGKGYSAQTDGERKHLHLGIHKGAVVNTRGYVAAKSELSQWLDFEQFLK